MNLPLMRDDYVDEAKRPISLKKQVSCFNHRVVALVAIMSELCEVSFGIRDLIALGNQRGSCSDHLTTTILLIVITTM